MGLNGQVKRNDRRFLAHRISLTALSLAAGLSGSLGILLTGTPAHAVDGNWLAAPATSDWNTGTNWSSNPAVPDNTAFFGASNTTSLSFSSLNTAIGTINFAVGAPAYTFTLVPATSVVGDKIFTINGSGIVNSSNSTQTFVVQANGFSGQLVFSNASTASNATINLLGSSFGGQVIFQNASTAGTATINSNGSGTRVTFKDTSTAANATYSSVLGNLNFQDASNAGNAHLNIDRSIVNFGFDALSTASAANAVIDNHGGTVHIGEGATGGNASITNTNSGNSSGRFLVGGSTTPSVGFGSAGNANVVNNNGGETDIQLSGTAGTATITNNSGGSLYFRFGNPDGSTARVINNAGGKVDISAVGSSGTSIGSIDGAGEIFLGSKILTVGNTNLSTQISGVISDCGPTGTGCSIFAPSAHTGGALVKIGTGTLTLSGANTYTGGTTISAGTLQLGNGATTGSVAGNILNNAILAFNRSNVLTFGGLISGTGAVQQNGAGSTILTAANTYTGGTTINAGTLQLGDGGAAGSIVGNVLNNGALAFNRSDAVTFGGVISGTGALQQNGAGSTNLTATNTYTGATTVNAGTLFVNGSIATSSGVTVNGGGTLGGTGALPTTTIAGGTLSPGNSIGTISIGGNLQFVGAGNYLVEVAPASADRTNATGTAALSGTLRATGTGGNYTVGTRYTVLNATGGISGTFGNLAISGNFGATRPHVEYDANNVYLVLDQGLITPFLVGGTRNQRAVAGAIDTALAGGNTAAPFLALFGLTSAQLPGALDQLSGEVHVSTAGVLADESRYMRDAVLGRLRQASYGGNASMASLSVGGPVAAFADGELDSALAYGKSPIVTKAPRMVAPSYDVTFWAQGFGARGRFETDGNAATVRRDLAGFISGVDTRVGGNGRLGIAAGYTGSKNALDGRGTADVETAHISGYGGWNFGAFNLRAGGAYAFHAIATDRLIAFPGFFDRTTANYDGQTGQVFGELGYGFALGNLAIEPFAGAAWVRVKTDAVAERGGLAALNVAGTTFETGYATLGIRAASMIPLGHDMVLIPRGTLAWQHALNTITPAGVLAFQAAPVPFTIAGVPIARDSLLTDAGLDLAIGRHATLGVSYTGQYASNVQDHAAKGKFSWKF